MSNVPPSPNTTASTIQAIQDEITEIQLDAASSMQIVTVESSVFGELAISSSCRLVWTHAYAAVYSVVMMIASILLMYVIYSLHIPLSILKHIQSDRSALNFKEIDVACLHRHVRDGSDALGVLSPNADSPATFCTESFKHNIGLSFNDTRWCAMPAGAQRPTGPNARPSRSLTPYSAPIS